MHSGVGEGKQRHHYETDPRLKATLNAVQGRLDQITMVLQCVNCRVLVRRIDISLFEPVKQPAATLEEMSFIEVGPGWNGERE